MALTRLQNIISSVEGRILYVNPDDFDATDAIDNKGNSPIRPFKTIARAVLEVARYSYVSAGNADDKFDQFTILLYPGDHIVDNRPGAEAYAIQGGNYVAGVGTFTDTPQAGNYAWNAATKQYDDLYKITNGPRGGLIIPRGTSIIGLDLRKTKIRPKYVPSGGTNTAPTEVTLNYTADPNNLSQLTIDQVGVGGTPTDINDLILESSFEKGVLGPKYFTPTAATYTATSGDLVLDIGNGHGLTINDYVKINTNSLKFECSMDGNSQRKTYPRPTDPYANTQIPVDSVTNNTITVNVGASPNVQHNVTNATYSPTTGIMQVTVGSGHGISAGETVKIADNAMRFTCDMDSTGDVKSYPRNLIKTFTATDAAYNPNTGIVTITVAGHGMDDGSWVKIADDSLTFSCGFGGAVGAAAEKTYPRSTDPISGHWIPVSNTTTDTFDIQCLHDVPSTNLDAHTFVSAVAGGITHKVDKAFDAPVEVVAADNAAGTIDLQVGRSPIVNFDVTNAAYNPTSGVLELTIGAHAFVIGQHIKLAANSLQFTCTLDGNTVTKSYPRASGEGANAGNPDYAYNRSLEITAVTATTITINVNAGGNPISDTSAHTYVGGTATNAVIAGGNYNHTWQVGYTATAGITSGGNYVHTFISALADSVVAETGVVVIEPGTKISSIDTQLGSSTIKVNLSKPHAYTSANGYSSNTSETGKIVKVPYEDDNSRAALFRITGGCYFWQFTMLDGDPVGIYNTATVEPQASWPGLVSPIRSHTKLTIFEFASQHDLFHFYRKVADSITLINAEKIEPKIQENRIVGALGDQVNIVSVSRNSNIVTVQLEEELNLTANNYVVITGDVTGNAGINPYYVGEKQVSSVITKTQFTFQLSASDESGLNSLEVDQDVNTANWQVTYTPSGCTAQVEIDTVESASPYIFNISLRSTYGTCGMHADGSRASGFKSMVVAQYTGISLQKDDGAFLKYNAGSGIYSNDGTTAYHTDINAVYNPLQRSYHVKCSNRAVIQAVSVFAVGYADHFIAEDGGDMSVTNSNSNFGSNAMRSIGFSDTAFNKDALGEITHIIPPRNIESTDTNFYWEAIDTQNTTNSKIFLTSRNEPAVITSGGSKFQSGNISQTVGGVTWVLGTTNGVVTSIVSYSGLETSNFQPGDIVTIDAAGLYPSGIGLPCTLTIGGSLTTKAGKFTVGGRNKNKDGTTVKDKIYVPLYVSGSPSTSEQSAEIDPSNSPQGNIFDWDTTANQWYVNVAVGSNTIFNTINGNQAKYSASGILSTPSSYLKRIVDERVDNDKIYRLRYTTKRNPTTGILPSYPQTGYVLQIKKGSGIAGVGDRFTDGANLLLLNKRFLAWETVARYKAANPSYVVPDQGTSGGDWNCQDDIISIVDAVAYNLRYGGNDEVWDAANLYNNLPAGQYLGSRDVIVAMIDTYLRPLMQSVIYNTAVTGAILNRDPGNSANIFYDQVTINNPANLNYAQGTCANVRNSSYTLLNIITTALGTDASPGNLTSVTRTTPSATYTRRSGFEFDDVYYVYDVEEITPYEFDGTNETPGVYYLTIVKASVGVDTSVLPGNTFKFSQNTDTLIPTIDIDNPVSDPIIARSSADPVLIGSVKTSTGLNAATTDPADPSFSITKEAISCYFYEYFNNELEWSWTGKNSPTSQLSHTVNLNNLDGTHGATTVLLQSGDGGGEIRKIDINPTRTGDTYQIELRRPSTIRSGNHTFEYVGFGPGNYSTAFPIKQTKILSPEEQKYSQSLKEQAGIAFYSGLNSNGDLYIGNTVINAVTGKTTENQITELDSLTIKDTLTVIGGSGNILNSNFQGPVTFLKSITGEGENIFSSISLRNPDGIISKLINNDAIPTGGASGDFQFNTDPQHGGYFGWSRGTDGVWRTAGLTELDKIHSYKDGSNYCLNIGSDIVDLSSDTTINTNYALDITTNQRIGGYLDIGSPSNKGTAISSNATGKDTQLSVFQDWTNNTTVFKPIEVTVQPGAFSGAAGSSLIDLRNGSDSVFNVDKDGNVAIKEGSTYGISDNAFFITLTVASNSNTSTGEMAFTNTGGPFNFSDVFEYVGASKGNATTANFGFKSSTDLNSFKTLGSDTGGAMYWSSFNARSMLVFINGVLQTPYADYNFDGTTLYLQSQPPIGTKIFIRALAN